MASSSSTMSTTSPGRALRTSFSGAVCFTVAEVASNSALVNRGRYIFRVVPPPTESCNDVRARQYGKPYLWFESIFLHQPISALFLLVRLRRRNSPAVGPEQGQHVFITVQMAHTAKTLVEAVPRFMRGVTGGRRVSQHPEQKARRVGGVPILSVVDDGIEQLVMLFAAEPPSERRDEVAEVRLRSAPAPPSRPPPSRTAASVLLTVISTALKPSTLSIGPPVGARASAASFG